MEAEDPLQADAMALKMASRISQLLHLSTIHYFIDSQVPATNTKAQDPILQVPDWRIQGRSQGGVGACPPPPNARAAPLHRIKNNSAKLLISNILAILPPPRLGS
jgi:hypothetical protein